MIDVLIVGAVTAAALGAGIHHALRQRRRRCQLEARRLSAAQRSLLERGFPLFGRLPCGLRERLEGLVHRFMEEKSFEACGGLAAVTEEMRLLIAAQACLLVLNNGQPLYPRLRSVLVYPDVFRVRDEWGEEDVRLGESWATGSVVLAWSQVRAGTRAAGDGLNVTLHEFAHQLDQLDGSADGLPEIGDWHDPGGWSEAWAPAYEQFCADVERGRRTVMDDYGASDPAEFFAVATETFFERPAALAREYPELYAQLRHFYQLDPCGWGRAC